MRRVYTMLFIAAALCVCSQGAWAWDLPLDIDLIKVHFNHNTGSTASDGITIQKNKTTITAPEYYPAASKYDECAYLMSVTAPTVKAEFYAYDLWQGYSNVSVITDSTDVWRLSESTMTFQPSGASGPVSFNTNANYQQAGSVGKYPFTWSWMVTKIDGDPVTPFKIGKSGHVLYNVLATPNAPMTVPWVEVLDYACVWAQGENSLVGAATKVAEGIYGMEDQDGKIEYHLDCFFTDDSYHERFYLTNFFNAIENDEDVHVNCDDCANLFCVFSSSIGCTSQTKEGAGDIWTRSVYVIGDVDPSIRHFGSHHFGWLENMVYDSSLLLTDIYNNVVYPYNMHINNYHAWLISSGYLTMMSPITTIIVN